MIDLVDGRLGKTILPNQAQRFLKHREKPINVFVGVCCRQETSVSGMDENAHVEAVQVESSLGFFAFIAKAA